MEAIHLIASSSMFSEWNSHDQSFTPRSDSSSEAASSRVCVCWEYCHFLWFLRRCSCKRMEWLWAKYKHQSQWNGKCFTGSKEQSTFADQSIGSFLHNRIVLYWVFACILFTLSECVITCNHIQSSISTLFMGQTTSVANISLNLSTPILHSVFSFEAAMRFVTALLASSSTS